MRAMDGLAHHDEAFYLSHVLADTWAHVYWSLFSQSHRAMVVCDLLGNYYVATADEVLAGPFRSRYVAGGYLQKNL